VQELFVRIFALAAVVFAASIAGVGQAASAFTTSKRPVVLMGGLKPDGWGASISQAQHTLLAYPGIVPEVDCFGILMRRPVVRRNGIIRYFNLPRNAFWFLFSGDPRRFDPESAWVYGMTRYWDKLFCIVGVERTPFVTLIFDPKSRNRWVIYRVKGASIDDLYGSFFPTVRISAGVEFVKRKP